MAEHRKRVRHYEDPGHVRELTFSCYRRLLLLTNDLWREMLCGTIDRAAASQGWALSAFVLMPNHVHLLVWPQPGAKGVHGLLWAIKRPYAAAIQRILKEHDSPLLGRLTIPTRPGVTSFRYWQEGPGYDRNLTTAPAVLAAIDYLHLNPVRRGLVDKATSWRWSSARYYETESREVDPAWPTLTPFPPEWFDERR